MRDVKMKVRYIKTKERGHPFKKCPHCSSTTWHIVLETAPGKPNILYCGDCFMLIEKLEEDKKCIRCNKLKPFKDVVQSKLCHENGTHTETIICSDCAYKIKEGNN